MNDYSGSTAELSNALTNSFAALGGLLVCLMVFALASAVFYVWLFYRIFQKSGYNGWMGLLSLIPSFGPLICLCILAFDRWPISKTVDGAAGEINGVSTSTPAATATPAAATVTQPPLTTYTPADPEPVPPTPVAAPAAEPAAAPVAEPAPEADAPAASIDEAS